MKSFIPPKYVSSFFNLFPLPPKSITNLERAVWLNIYDDSIEPPPFAYDGIGGRGEKRICSRKKQGTSRDCGENVESHRPFIS